MVKNKNERKFCYLIWMQIYHNKNKLITKMQRATKKGFLTKKIQVKFETTISGT